MPEDSRWTGCGSLPIPWKACLELEICGPRRCLECLKALYIWFKLGPADGMYQCLGWRTSARGERAGGVVSSKGESGERCRLERSMHCCRSIVRAEGRPGLGGTASCTDPGRRWPENFPSHLRTREERENPDTRRCQPLGSDRPTLRDRPSN